MGSSWLWSLAHYGRDAVKGDFRPSFAASNERLADALGDATLCASVAAHFLGRAFADVSQVAKPAASSPRVKPVDQIDQRIVAGLVDYPLLARLHQIEQQHQDGAFDQGNQRCVEAYAQCLGDFA